MLLENSLVPEFKTIIEAAVARFYEFRALQQELEKNKNKPCRTQNH